MARHSVTGVRTGSNEARKQRCLVSSDGDKQMTDDRGLLANPVIKQKWTEILSTTSLGITAFRQTGSREKERHWKPTFAESETLSQYGEGKSTCPIKI